VLYSAKAGFDWIMHASYIDDEGIEACLKNKVAITPTLTLLINMIDSGEGEVGASALAVFKREVDAAADGLSRAYKAGVPLIAGSESGWSLVPFGNWHAKEMEIFVDLLGLSPLEALHTATGGAARTQARLSDEIGVLEAGRLADLIVINGDPLKDIKVLQQKSRFHMVMQGGRAVDLTTPIPDPPRWAYEKHRLYLPGNYVYNENMGRGETVVPN
jgi:imidazolonepropionase-like amidohydrolase